MAQTFTGVPIRNNGDKFFVSWVNLLRLAGVNLEGFLGAAVGAITETAFSFANNQSSAANVTGALFSSATCKSVWMWISVRRTNGTAAIFTETEVWMSYNTVTSSWMIVDQDDHGDPSGLVFSVTAGGQVQYTSSNLPNSGGGSYADASKFKAQVTGV